jgi:hypothetical protein
MYLPTSASLEYQGPEDFLSVCLSSNGSSAGAPKDEYRCHVTKHRGGTFSPMASSLSSHAIEVDVDAPARAPKDRETTVLVNDVPV